MMVTADVAVFVVCRVYRNFSSTFLLGSTIVLMLFRLMGYAFRLLSKEVPIWERFEVDLPGYIFGIISIVLLFQWVQTYKVLSDPVRAMDNTMSSNTSFYCQIIFVVIYTLFIMTDFLVIYYDREERYRNREIYKAD